MGNKPNTRMITLYKRFDKKTCRAAEKYRTAWSALCVLDPDGSWSVRLKELKREHISGPGKEPDDSSNSRYQPSWIWLVPCASGLRNVETTIGEDEFNKSMQVEWSKARARMRRWNEELLIIKEEMQRAIVYHKGRVSSSGYWGTTRDCHGLLYLAGYSRRVQQGTGTGWVYPTLALPLPPAGGWRVGGGSAHSNSARKACQWSTQTTSDTSYVGKFSYLFLIFLSTTQVHEGPQRPMKANAGQRRPTQAHEGPQQPTKANEGQHRPTAANEGQCKAHNSQRRPTKAIVPPYYYIGMSFLIYILFFIFLL